MLNSHSKVSPYAHAVLLLANVLGLQGLCYVCIFYPVLLIAFQHCDGVGNL